MSTTVLAKNVAEILPPAKDGSHYLDFAGNEIDCVYSYNPPYYAVYRTRVRVMVQYADTDQDKGEKAGEQRVALRPLTALRGQVNALIDGWHTAGEKPEHPSWSWRLCYYLSFGWLPCRDRWHEETRKRAVRYDRRMADAIVTALEGDTPTAYALLQEVKNDIVSERTSIARVNYLVTTFILAAVAILLIWLFTGLRTGAAPADRMAIGITGGTIGAFFSVAIGLRGRTVLIDLQNRDNIADAVLRVLIGAMSGGILLCLLLSGLVQLPGIQLAPNPAAAATPQQDPNIMILVLGFFAGFFERLVPNLLEKTNLGSQSAASAVPPAVGPNANPNGARNNGGEAPDKSKDGDGQEPERADPGATGEEAEGEKMEPEKEPEEGETAEASTVAAAPETGPVAGSAAETEAQEQSPAPKA